MSKPRTTRTWRRCATAGLAALALGVAGCGGGGTPAADSDGVLTIWMMTGGPGDDELIQDVNSEFAATHPDMRVDIQVQQWDSIATKLTTALATDNPPDIVEMGNTQTPLQTWSGGLADLTDVRDSFEDSADWLTGLAAPSEYDGRLYAVPLYGGTKVVMYNKDLFAAAGITQPPRTLDEVVDLCGRLAAANASVPDFSGFYLPGQYWFAGVPFLFGQGGTIATESPDGWTATMSDPRNIAGLQEWRSVQNACSTPSSIGVNTTNPDQNQLFADGRTAMTYVKAWEPATVLEKNPAMKDKIGFFPMPGYTPDATLPVIVAGSTIGVAANSPDQAAAVDWLRIVTSRGFQEKMAQKLNLLPIVPGFTPASGVTQQLTVAAQAARISSPLPVTPGQATLETEKYNEQFFSSIAGGADIPTAAAEYDRHATDAFNALRG
jgi:N,N'-diacetylchitobiose transport system substrate-binding protein